MNYGLFLEILVVVYMQRRVNNFFISDWGGEFTMEST
jgi:hypothetical protein